MRKMRKTLCVLLAALLLTAALASPVFAATDVTVREKAEHTFYRIADKLIMLLGKVLNVMIPGLDWTGATPAAKSYVTHDFYEGSTDFRVSPAEGAVWRMGFAERSFLTDIDPLSGEYYMAGTMEVFEGRAPTAVLDDQGVNAFALSDGTNTVVYAAVDGYGIARGDVLEIRSRIADFAAEHNVTSVNVSALHQHSCIDILGFGAPLAKALVTNPGASLFKKDAVISGRNKVFMEKVYTAVAESLVSAVENMTAGQLYYGSADISAYLKDKRDPAVFDPDLQRLRFVPYDGAKNEIWVCETGMHPVNLGAGTDQVSGDYPYYLEQYVKEQTGADLVFVQGAELAITSGGELNYDDAAGANARAKAIGAALGEALLTVANETPLPPVLNAAHRELFMDVDNEILTLAGREGLLGSVFVKKGLGYAVVTEIGYLELGGKLGILLVPGEIDPAILWGGAPDETVSWTGGSS